MGTPEQRPPSILSFSAKAAGAPPGQLPGSLQVAKGTAVTLSWQLEGVVEDLILDGATQPLKLSATELTVKPERDADFTLQASNSWGVAFSDFVHVSVHAPDEHVAPHLSVQPPIDPRMVIEDGGNIVVNAPVRAFAEDFTWTPGASISWRKDRCAAECVASVLRWFAEERRATPFPTLPGTKAFGYAQRMLELFRTVKGAPDPADVFHLGAHWLRHRKLPVDLAAARQTPAGPRSPLPRQNDRRLAMIKGLLRAGPCILELAQPANFYVVAQGVVGGALHLVDPGAVIQQAFRKDRGGIDAKISNWSGRERSMIGRHPEKPQWPDANPSQAEWDAFRYPALSGPALDDLLGGLQRLHSLSYGAEIDEDSDDSRRWFVDMSGFLARRGQSNTLEHPLFMPDPRIGNEVRLLLTGAETFNAMAEAMKTANKRDHFIYLANWVVFDDLNLERGNSDGPTGKHGTTLSHHLARASGQGVMIRGLFWARSSIMGDVARNVDTTNFINGLKNGDALLDDRVQAQSLAGQYVRLGSHHQKLLLVNGEQGLIAFAGGVDFHPNRVLRYGDRQSDSGKEILHDKTAPQLDVHVRIRGPAAYDLLEIFLRRYADQPPAPPGRPTRSIRPLSPDRRPVKDLAAADRVTVRVCASFGRNLVPPVLTAPGGKAVADVSFAPGQDTLSKLVPRSGSDEVRILGGPSPNPRAYSFAPRGRQSGRAQLLYAISSARKFIYFEDQYMVSREIAEALRDAVLRGVRVLGVIPHQSISPDFDVVIPDDLPKSPGWVQGIAPLPSLVLDAASGTKVFTGVLASTRLSRVIDVIHGSSADPAKLNFLFSPARAGTVTAQELYQYVHSKVFILDDAFCTIGSMNFNRRSTTHDSELSLGFYQPGSGGIAQRLRQRLWARHLGLAQGELELLAHPIKAIDELWSQVQVSMRPVVLPGGRLAVPNAVRYDWSKDERLEGRGKMPSAALTLFGGPFTALLAGDDLETYVDDLADPVVTSPETDLPLKGFGNPAP